MNNSRITKPQRFDRSDLKTWPKEEGIYSCKIKYEKKCRAPMIWKGKVWFCADFHREYTIAADPINYRDLTDNEISI